MREAKITRIRKQPAAADPTDAEDEIDLSRWFEAFRRRRKLLAAVAGSVLAVAVLLYVITPRSYRAATTIQIERPTAGSVSMEEVLGADNYWDAQSYYPTQYKLLESRGLAERVVHDLGLAANPVFNPPRSSLFGDDASQEVTAADDERATGALARRLLDDLDVNPVRNTRLVELAYVAPDPTLAAKVANGVAEAYIDWGIENRSVTVGRASDFLTSQIEKIKTEIQDKEAQLQAYSRRSDIVALDPNSNVVLQRLEALNRDYTGAVSERIEKEAKYNEVVNAPRETVADTFSGGLVTELRRDQLELEQEYATKLNTYKPEWPAMQELKAKIDKGGQHVQTVVDEMVEEAKKNARSEYQTALRREQSLDAELNKQKREAMRLNSAAVEYNNLLVEVSTRRELLDELLRKQSETGVANRLQGTRSSNVVIVDRALVPVGPYRPSLPRNLALGLVLGLMLGVAAIVVVEITDRNLHGPEDVERVLGVPILGVVPDIRTGGKGAYGAYGYGYGAQRSKKHRWRRKKVADSGDATAGDAGPPGIELLPHRHPRLAVAEAYRSIRTAILLSTAGGLQSLVVTSANPREGKTATSVNIAVVLAQLGHKVLLLDTDFRKPRLHEVFRQSNRRGLVNHLTTGIAVSEIIRPTEVDNLFLVPAGPSPPNASELLASKAMRAFVDGAKQHCDFVVMDSPPLIAVTDATILGALADGVVFCVGADIATRESAVGALDRLDVGDVRVLGAVVNLFQTRGSRYGTNYSSYYAHTAYGDDSPDAPPSAAVGT